MIKAAIDRILELKRETMVKIGEREYSTVQLSSVRAPVCSALDTHTLSGVLDWLSSGDYAKGSLIHVVSHDRVNVIGSPNEEWKQRDEHLNVSLQSSPFSFGRYMELEDFAIAFQCLFVETENKKNVLRFLASVRGEDVIKLEDDGVSQAVTVENKIGRLEPMKTEPMISLAPYRTFAEIAQPESMFLLRMRRDPGTQPYVALFEADGGQWKNSAIDGIASFFIKSDIVKKLGVDVIA